VLRLRAPRGTHHLRLGLGGSGSLDFTVLVFKTDGRVHPGWLAGQCKSAGIPTEVAFEFVADLSEMFGMPLHRKHADMLTEPAPLEIVHDRWEAVGDRIEELAEVIVTHQL
jgi:hypothetical protein